jgi:predicted glycogen debranching enzyme
MISTVDCELKNFDYLCKNEWLETNGLGGYASDTIANFHTRRYHGLLVAATVIPTGRMVLVSKLEEIIISNNNLTELGCNNYNGTIHPHGYKHLKAFKKDIYPEWIYQVGDIIIKKSLLQLHKKNTTIIKYEVLEAGSAFRMLLKPLLTARDHHSLWRSNSELHWDVDFNDGVFHNNPLGTDVDIYIAIPGSTYRHAPQWYYNFSYQEEINRGLDHMEDLICHGEFEVSLKAGDIISVVLSTENPENLSAEKAFADETWRRMSLLGASKRNEITDVLKLAANQFIVERNVYLHASQENTHGATVIAGYHWFTDWGRDTMIGLTGLCLSTGRLDDAKKILKAFSQNISQGMLPNFFSDRDGVPEFNNVDATLWYFIAVYQFFNAGGDQEFVLTDLLPILVDIIEWHDKGTRYNIKVDPDDQLLYAGEKGQQLTWMDARIGDLVFTPRMGKPVEIEALWYNALCIVSYLCKQADKTEEALAYDRKSSLVKSSFEKFFWFESGGYLYDNINEYNVPDDSFRPNQLFAISLPFALIKGKKAKAIMEKITKKLYTPVGLRSLAQDHPNYCGIYHGDQYSRDSKYHQGTVWSWLLGPYIDALVKTKAPKSELKKVIERFSYHFQEGCIGTISEIFDGDVPHAPKGCAAQAWSVGELLRVITAYGLV